MTLNVLYWLIKMSRCKSDYKLLSKNHLWHNRLTHLWHNHGVECDNASHILTNHDLIVRISLTHQNCKFMLSLQAHGFHNLISNTGFSFAGTCVSAISIKRVNRSGQHLDTRDFSMWTIFPYYALITKNKKFRVLPLTPHVRNCDMAQ